MSTGKRLHRYLKIRKNLTSWEMICMSILLASNKVFKNYLHGIFELVQKKYVYNWQFLLLYHLHKFIEDYKDNILVLKTKASAYLMLYLLIKLHWGCWRRYLHYAKSYGKISIIFFFLTFYCNILQSTHILLFLGRSCVYQKTMLIFL